MRPTHRAAPLLLAALIGLLGACGGPPPPDTNVVLVLVDQLRKDSADRWMPRVGALADEGIRFEKARSAAPWTYPSVVSMFSGLYPQQHGADGHPIGGTQLATFDDGVPLLPRRLRSAGFHTAGFVTNPFLQKWNPLHTAFDHYEVDAFIGSQGPLRGAPKLVWRPETMFADSVNAKVREHFDARALDGPEFTYVHYIDVHGPWEGAPFADAAFLAMDEEARYEASIGYVDGKIAELHEYFHARYDGRMIFLVTSDHGRELGDDLDIGEGRSARVRKATVHDFNTRIPLMVLPSALVTGPRTVDVSVSNADLAPTVLDWVGLEPARAIPGRSLLPAIEGQRGAYVGRPVYSLMSAFNRRNDCIVLGGRKLMRVFDPKSRAVTGRVVFDLETDPREASPREEPFGSAGRQLASAAETDGIEYPSRFEEPDESTIKNLEALGYFGGDE